jgi:hypothetical protein
MLVNSNGMRRTASLSERSAASRWLRACPVLLALLGTGMCGGETDRAGPAPSTGAGGGEAAGATVGTGGSANGGTAPSGGAETGGAETGGGTETGGAETGGATNGGASSGGTSSGGAETPSAGGAESGGGSSGAGPVLFPECETNEDCEIKKDCCSCEAVPKGTSVAMCRVACGDSNGCEQRGISTSAQCTLGRCTLSASCGGGSGVSCTTDPPECPAGQAPTVTEDGCWGPCVVATECPDIADCAVCGDAHCVRFPGVGLTITRCIARQPECTAGTLCECLAPCGEFGCAERDGEVGCFCAGC